MTDPVWRRETTIKSSIALQTPLLEAIRAHIVENDLGPVEAQALVCFETVSRSLKRGGLLLRLAGASHKLIITAAIVTPTRLIWAMRLDEEEAFASSELLMRLDVRDYESGPEYQILPDHGVQIHGVPAGDGRTGTVFFGLGEGPGADQARQILKQAARAAHGEGPPVVTHAGDAAGDPGETGELPS